METEENEVEKIADTIGEIQDSITDEMIENATEDELIEYLNKVDELNSKMQLAIKLSDDENEE